MKQKKFNETIEWLKSLDINGCITGSCLIDCDKEDWQEIPDIDIFCYSVGSWADAISMLVNKYDYKFGLAEAPEYAEQERWKYKNTLQTGIWKQVGISTVKLYKDNINVNFSIRKGQYRAIDIISNFDMTCICRAYDIPTKHYMDYSEVWAKEYMETIYKYPQDTRPLDKVTPNPHKLSDEYDMFTAQKWLRQWERIVKYWDRGFNTIEVALFYSRMLDEVIKRGNIFQSEKSQEVYDENIPAIIDVKKVIDEWIEEKKKALGD